MAKIDTAGKLGLGPAAYLPPRYTLTDGQIITGKNPANDLQYNSVSNITYMCRLQAIVLGKIPGKEWNTKYITICMQKMTISILTMQISTEETALPTVESVQTLE